ncbi:hypothetical protein ANCCEY_04587 [Ancylostoma ceylanicum]|uniref:G-protein coupled receptors family 1 profile domain-containing protein n=1 Tax=Ancylostoma ceylanicum TaxID=53326 RepID=A0A0D6LWB4_9BILA|nr:hypothetical protein ANCCEY_04587 [Ancylostoma ceylanicum]
MAEGLDPVLLPLMFVFTTIPTIGIIGNTIMVIATYKARLVQCSVPQGYGSVAFPIFNNIGFVLNVLSVLVYVFSFYMLRRSKANSKMRTVFKSIFITVAIVIVGWFATFLINTLAFLLTDSDYLRMVIGLYAGITVNIGLAANVFVYYAIKYVPCFKAVVQFCPKILLKCQ